MGYRIFLLHSDFSLALERREAALQAIQCLDPRVTYPGGTDPHFAFVATAEYQQARTLPEALRAWRWLVETDEQENIVHIEFVGEKLGDEATLFKALAPFVREGSSIVVAGDDGRVWRWFFAGGGVEEQEGEIVFPARPRDRDRPDE